MNGELTGHRVPKENQEISIHRAKTKAVGLTAVYESFKQMKRYMDMPKALKASLKMNQIGGFDCPGCAWPDPEDERSPIAEYCENGIKAMVEEATKKRADNSFFNKYTVQELSGWSDFELGKSGRIVSPMMYDSETDKYKNISWSSAFELIAKELKALENPNEAIFYTSGRTSNEAAFMYGLMVRYFGTNNLPDCSNMCHESSGAALSKTVGIGKGSVTLQDLHEAELVIIMGQNPGTNHPRMLNALEKNKVNGGTIVAVNPLKEAGLLHYTNPQKPLKIVGGGVNLADHYLQVRINGDLGLLKAIIYKLFQREKKGEKIFDHSFIRDKTEAYDELKNHYESVDLEECIKDSGLREKDIDILTELIVKKEKIIVCWAMGLTQHVNGVATIQEIVNLLLLKGSIAKSGAGTCPVRGHSNVQGDRTMGIWEKMSSSFHDRLGKAFDFDSPKQNGWDTVESIIAMQDGRAKVFFGMGGNFLSATPDTDYTAKALRRCKLTVHVSTKLNRSHLVHGEKALILPCKGRTEIDEQKSGYQFVSVENSMGQVHSSKGVLPPASNILKSEVEIVCELAHTLFPQSKVDWLSYRDDYNLIRDKIEEVISGFEGYNKRVRQDYGFYLPNPARDGRFRDNGKALFTINPLEIQTEQNKDTYQLMTIRAHDQYNTTIYGMNDRYRGIENGRKIIFMNKKDMDIMGLKTKQSINIHSDYNGKRRSIFSFRVIPYDIPLGCLAAYFPEANPLVPIDLVAKESNTPVSKNIRVSISL